MKFHAALDALVGQKTDYFAGGPLEQISQRLVAQFREAEESRLARADERYSAGGTLPYVAALAERAAAERGAAVLHDYSPLIPIGDAAAVIRAARTANPHDRGVGILLTHVEHMLYQQPEGVLTVGDVARLRAHYSSEHPKSVLAHVLDVEIPRVSFSRLPVGQLAAIASQVVGNDDASRQASYAEVVRAHGLDSNLYNHRIARHFIREIAEISHTAALAQAAGQDVASVLYSRMASHQDPILMRVAQMMPSTDAPAPGHDVEPVMAPGEEEIPHDENTEVLEEVESPITGEMLSLELGVAEQEQAPGMPGAADGTDLSALPPGQVTARAGRLIVGQLQDYQGPDPMMAPTPGAEVMPEETYATIPDPSSPGNFIDVTLAPSMDDAMPSDGAMGAPNVMPGAAEDGTSLVANRRFVYRIFASEGGAVADEPMDEVECASMTAALQHVGRQLILGRQTPLTHAVWAHPDSFAVESIVDLDPTRRAALIVRRADTMTPKVHAQPPVQNQLSVSKTDADDILMDEAEELTEMPQHGQKSAKLSRSVVTARCAKRGLTAAKIEERIFAGKTVKVGNLSIRLNDADCVELWRGQKGREANLEHLDRTIGDFMTLVASLPRRQLTASARPLMAIDCRRCAALNEYLIPEEPLAVKCGSCGWETQPFEVAAQLDAKGFAGYVLTADVPGKKDKVSINAKRMLHEIKQVVRTARATVTDGRLEVRVVAANEKQLARLARVLADKFGAKNTIAQVAPMAPQPMVQPTAPIQPGQPAPGATGPAALQPGPSTPPVGSPQLAQLLPQPTAGSGADLNQQNFIEEHARMARVLTRDAHNWRSWQHRVAQMGGDPAAMATVPPGGVDIDIPSPGGAPPAGGPGGPGGPGAPPPTGAAPSGTKVQVLSKEAVEGVTAPMVHFRDTGKSIDEAITEFTRLYKQQLAAFGDSTSPLRRAVGDDVVEIAKDVYSRPALLGRVSASVPAPRAARAGSTPVPGQLRAKVASVFAEMRRLNKRDARYASLRAQLVKFERVAHSQGMDVGALYSSLGARPVTAQRADFDPGVRQMTDQVNVPNADTLMTEGVTEEGPSEMSPSVKTQPDKGKDQGASSSDGGWGAQWSETESNDPGRFEAPKPPKDGHVNDDAGWGVSYSETETDPMLGEGSEAASWDAVSSGARPQGGG